MTNLLLTSHQVKKIEMILHHWSNKLTWEALVNKIDSDLKIQTTRQTLNTYMNIKKAFSDTKFRLRETPQNYRRMPQISLKKRDL